MASLVVVYPLAMRGREFPLPPFVATIGRGADCEVRIASSAISKQHARLVFRGDDWTIEDLDSTNGCYVNDVPVATGVLRDTDLLRIGGVVFRFDLAGRPAFTVPRKQLPS